MLKKTTYIFIFLVSSFNIIYSNENVKLFYAILNENLNAVKTAVQNGAEVNARDPLLNRTALMLISFKGNKLIAEFLISKGADVNTKNSEGWTALMWACDKGYIEITKLLISKGANVKAKTNKGLTALSIAVTKGFKEIEELLINFGTNK